MTNPNPRWRPMTGQLPIVGIAPPLKAAFAPSAPGTLAIKARSGASLPSGKLVLIATSKSLAPGRSSAGRRVHRAHGGL